MENLLTGIDEILLLGPGPSCVTEDVYQALARPTIGHLDPYFIRIMDEVKEMTRQLMNTRNHMTIPLSGTGSLGMEACFANLVERGDPILILINGVFGMRMQDLAGRLGAEIDSLAFDWGTPVDVEAVERKISEKPYKILAVVHAETSTGVCNPIREIGELVKDTDMLYLVDAVTSLAGMEIQMDAWGIDALFSCSQKCISCPPGLSPFSFSEKALEALKNRKTKVPNWYVDMSLLMSYWEGAKRVYHHTAPINMHYAFYQSLCMLLSEGLEKVYERHLENHKRLVEGLEKMGLEMFVDEPHRLPMLNTVKIPEEVDGLEVRLRLLNEYKIDIGLGLGAYADKLWRIGLMGYSSRAENVDRLLEAFSAVI